MELQLGEKHPSNPAQSSPIHNPPAFIKTWCPVLVYLFSLSSSNPLMGCYRRKSSETAENWKNLSQGSESMAFLMLGNCSETSKSMAKNPQNLGKSSGNPWLPSLKWPLFPCSFAGFPMRFSETQWPNFPCPKPWPKSTKSVEENQVQPTKNRAWQEAVLANKTHVLS